MMLRYLNLDDVSTTDNLSKFYRQWVLSLAFPCKAFVTFLTNLLKSSKVIHMSYFTVDTGNVLWDSWDMTVIYKTPWTSWKLILLSLLENYLRYKKKKKGTLKLVVKQLFWAWEGHDYKGIQFLTCFLLEQSDFIITVAEIYRSGDPT